MMLRVNYRIENSGQQREVWFLFRTDHKNMAEVHSALVRDGSLCGERMETKRVAEGVREVRDRYDAIIVREAITSICEPMEDLIEDGKMIWTLDGGEVAA